jgi:hypothetical protein
VRLAAGDYGTFSGGAKPATVTLAPAPGAVATLAPSLNGSSHIAFDGLTIAGAYVANSQDVAFRNSRFTGMTRVDANLANANVVFDRNTFDGIDQCSTCYEGRLTVRGFEDRKPSGVIVTNNHFGGGGGSDGVQLVGGAYGVQIGPGNEFTGLRQGSYAAHVDPIQLYGSSHTLITGNYFHGNSTGIMAPNGGDTETIANNVFVMDEYPWAVIAGYQPNLTVVHNTMAGGTLRIDDGGGAISGATANVTIRDNAFMTGVSYGSLGRGAISVEDYNLAPSGGTGSHDIKARPVFAGGSSPSGFAAFQLAAGTLGKGAASDGTDMGVNVSAGSPATPPAPPASAGQPASVGRPGASSRRLDGAPVLELVRPAAGRLGRMLALRAVATDDVGIVGVELWIDSRRIATRVRAPFGARRPVRASLRHGAHTVTARAFDADGHVASAAAAIAGGRVLAGRVTSVQLAGGGTEFRSTGFRRRAVTARVARCGGGAPRRVRLTSSRSIARVTADGLCVVSLAPSVR